MFISKYLLPYAGIIFFTAITVLFVTWPFFHDGFFQIMDDVHVVRIELLTQELMQGQFPVRYSNALGNGGGYMLFHFYPPFTYYMGSLFHLLGFTLVKSTKLVFLVAYLIGASGIVFLLKKYSDTVSTILGMIMFLTATYLSFDVYFRGSLGEVFGFMLLPWLYLTFLYLRERITPLRVLGSGIIFSLIVISHSFVALSALGFLLLLMCFPPYRKRTVTGMLLAILIGLGITIFFWLPVFIEKSYTVYDSSYFAISSFKGNFLSPLQVGGIAKISWAFRPPLLGIGLFLGTIVSILYFLWKRKKSIPQQNLLWYFIFSFVISLLLIWDISYSLWEHIPLLQQLQFPYRFLTFTTFFSVIIISFFLTTIKKNWIKILIGICIIMPAITLQYNYLRPTVYTYVAQYKAEDGCTTTTWAQEYLPIWVKECIPKKTVIPLVKAKNNHTKIIDLQTAENGRKITFTTEGKANEVIIGKYFFPGWLAQRESKINIPLSPYGKYGLIVMHVPEGVHKVSVQFGNTPVRLFSNIVSSFSIIMVVILVVFFLGINYRSYLRNKAHKM